MKAGRGSEQSAEGVSLWGGSALKEHAHFFAAGTPARGITHFRQTHFAMKGLEQRHV